MTRFTPQQEAEYREVMAAKAAREHAEDIAMLAGLPRATIAKAVAACRSRGVLSREPLPADPGSWSPYQAAIVRACLDHHAPNAPEPVQQDATQGSRPVDGLRSTAREGPTDRPTPPTQHSQS